MKRIFVVLSGNHIALPMTIYAPILLYYSFTFSPLFHTSSTSFPILTLSPDLSSYFTEKIEAIRTILPSNFPNSSNVTLFTYLNLDQSVFLPVMNEQYVLMPSFFISPLVYSGASFQQIFPLPSIIIFSLYYSIISVLPRLINSLFSSQRTINVNQNISLICLQSFNGFPSYVG